MTMDAEQQPNGVTAEEAVTTEATDGVHGTPAEDAADLSASSVEQDLDELVAKAAKADEYLELAQRTQADFENFRKRATRDVSLAQERGIGKLAKELLPALDNLDRALAAAEAPADAGHGQPEHHLTAGIKLVHDELLAALTRVGIERFSPKGARFDPNEHEAVVQQPVEGAESGTVVEVYQSGYRLGGLVLRPARVVVAA
ncbi:nucleotide exchange factor GrpE [Conexibacter sp. CPCC 206217]|uniref:nucleotide exchange factor GrpE n=1 Tax=Conexibacter sp. CPCC 206217 TaxID=3064574 RepID=UPI00271D370C|nr:nucleotide exchange factor GrpE [Conexibacter sp. CPCC 206217]MDO8211584.1 nucleotide exchange factor GrpE [Conexibacter sp. CPCC 206217]